uniref:Variant surface glycoprotein 1125.1717 n=1 Tax=Trypanosoma brucei TaxID=5691 RepID=A0A1J0R7L0_9TRYP|nr:variant surface glycoprotein 1125.1717 [Trypanosoma brucei]
MSNDPTALKGRSSQHITELTAFWLFVLPLLTAQANPDETAANAAIKDLCTLDIYYAAIEAELKQWLADAGGAPEEITRQLESVTLAAEKKKETSKGIGYQALCMILSSRLKEAAAYVAAATQKIPAALAAIAARRTEQNTLLGALESAKETTFTHTADSAAAQKLTTSSGQNARRCKATMQPALTFKKQCTPAAADATAARGVGAALKSLKKLKTLKNDQAKQPKVSVTFEAAGDLSSGSNWVTGPTSTHCEKHGGNGSVITSAGNAMAATEATTTVDFQADELTLDTAATANIKTDLQTTDGERAWLTNNEDLANALRTAQQVQTAAQKAFSKESLKTLAETPEARALYDFLTTGLTTRPSEPADVKKVAKLIFGKEEGDVTTEFLKELSTDTLSIPTTGEPLKESTQTIASGSNLQDAIAYYYIKNLKKATDNAAGTKPEGNEKADALKKGEKKDGDNKTAEVCTGTEENKCDKNKCT